jgi:hypothetical protein
MTQYHYQVGVSLPQDAPVRKYLKVDAVRGRCIICDRITKSIAKPRSPTF